MPLHFLPNMLHCYNHSAPNQPGPAVYDPFRHNLRCPHKYILQEGDRINRFTIPIMCYVASGIMIRTRYHHSPHNLALASLSLSTQTLYFLPSDGCFSSVSYFHSIFKDCQKCPSQTLAGTDEEIYLKHMEDMIRMFTYIFWITHINIAHL